MPKILNRTEEEKQMILKQQKRECYNRHKELYRLISLRSYYANRLKLNRDFKEPNELKEQEIINRLREINGRINELRQK